MPVRLAGRSVGRMGPMLQPPREVTPYTELDRAAWAQLAETTESPLTAEEVERLRGLGDEIDIDEVREVYLPLSRILSLYVRHARALHSERGIPRPAGSHPDAVRDRHRWFRCRRQV